MTDINSKTGLIYIATAIFYIIDTNLVLLYSFLD